MPAAVLLAPARTLTPALEVATGDDAHVLVSPAEPGGDAVVLAVGAEAVRRAGELGAVRVPLSRRLLMPGFVNSHSHAFQRALRGVGEGAGTFWSWRDRMYGWVKGATADEVYSASLKAFREMRRVGISTCAEFAYLHHETAESCDFELSTRAVVRAACDADVRLVLLVTAYESAGVPGADDAPVPLEPAQRRFETSRFRGADFAARVEEIAGSVRARSVDVGVAAHSVRAVTRDTLRALAASPLRERHGLHIHVEEQARELDECAIANDGATPSEVIWQACCAERGSADGLVAVHATHTSGADIERHLRAGGMVCVCPLTEGSLGDGVPRWIAEHGLDHVCIGTDSNARIDMLEEVRALEYSLRAAERRRGVCALSAGERDVPRALLSAATAHGARALRMEHAVGRIAPGHYADFCCVDLDAPALAGVSDGDLLGALVFGCSSEAVVAETCVGGRWAHAAG